MSKRTLIITNKQLNEVNDMNKTIVNFTGTNASELGANGNEAFNDAKKGGLKPQAITLQGRTPTNNATDDDEVKISFDTTKPNIKDAITNAFQSAVNNGADPNKITVDGNTEDILNGTSENKIFTKKMIDEARLFNMKKNGKILTKKQFVDSF